jgi:hypothetical protein
LIQSVQFVLLTRYWKRAENHACDNGHTRLSDFVQAREALKVERLVFDEPAELDRGSVVIRAVPDEYSDWWEQRRKSATIFMISRIRPTIPQANLSQSDIAERGF